ncbi:hypothetical protein E2C01_025045 [Portunus trituberculatus]|uniref:Uncharacterized protein n=1 Tax=Portunus trituberculatus TaxID=210409 RepID=A0A5B7EE15_PORTR|nr:hypothetical protein [Portunus trituberculatus]
METAGMRELQRRLAVLTRDRIKLGSSIRERGRNENAESNYRLIRATFVEMTVEKETQQRNGCGSLWKYKRTRGITADETNLKRTASVRERMESDSAVQCLLKY